MWCSYCHQDVPAVASEGRGSRTCAKCSRELKFTAQTTLVDTGIALETFDAPVAAVETIDPLVHLESRENLRRLGRQLRAPYQQRVALDTPPFWERLTKDAPESSAQLRAIARQVEREAEELPYQQKSLPLSFLLSGGILAFVCGSLALLWAAAFNQAYIWQWGLTTTLAAEGILIVGLVWMAGRLWHNSRHLNHQLRGVDEQLDEIHELAGSISAQQLSASQNYYHHFSQVANPHMLVANLRGQIDQLAERIAG
jgi:hypothetical protein